MLCCSSTVEENLEPYQVRVLLIKRIHRLAQKGIFGQAINVFREISKNLGVNEVTKRLGHLGLADLLAAKEFLVDREAHRYLQRLQEALFCKNERQVSYMCQLLIKQFNFDPTEEIMKEINRDNKETLQKSDLAIICIDGLDLSKKQNFRKLLTLLSRCPKLKKIEVAFCKLGQNQLLQLFEEVKRLETIHFLGFRGNRLDEKAVQELLRLLKEPDNFQNLLWVDFRNNNKINTIPGQFVMSLAERREKNPVVRKASNMEILLNVQDAIRGMVV